MSTLKTLREGSRQDCSGNVVGGGFTLEEINTGSLQRIADALEKVALNYDALLRSKKKAEELSGLRRHRLTIAEHRIAGLLGYIRRLKRAGKDRS